MVKRTLLAPGRGKGASELPKETTKGSRSALCNGLGAREEGVEGRKGRGGGSEGGMERRKER